MYILSQLKKLFTKKPQVIVVLGATSTGKSDMAVEIAKQYNGEIISADSRQVYRGMDLGSGKITQEEMQNIPHHLLDVADPNDRFTAHDFRDLGRKAIHEILERNKTPIICGGTGFYIDSLLQKNPLASTPPNQELREKLEGKNLGELQDLLAKKINIKKYPHIDIKNKVRIIRALEIIEDKGYIPKIKNEIEYDVLFIGLELEKEDLQARIHKRILNRIDQGMIEEVEELVKQGIKYERLYELGLEYRYISLYLQGELNKTEMVTSLHRDTCRFAKRQKTWFKRNKATHWFNPLSDSEKIFSLVNNFLK